MTFFPFVSLLFFSFFPSLFSCYNKLRRNNYLRTYTRHFSCVQFIEEKRKEKEEEEAKKKMIVIIEWVDKTKQKKNKENNNNFQACIHIRI